MKTPSFIETYTGRRFTPLDPWPGEIVIEDIAHHLSNQCRFSGAVRRFYSVAEHSVRVSFACDPVDALWGLLHDASEAYLVDLPRPLKHAKGFHGYRVAEKRLMRAVCERFGLPADEPKGVKTADQVLLSTEVRELMPARREHWKPWLSEKPLKSGDLTFGWEPKTAERAFLRRFWKLTEGK